MSDGRKSSLTTLELHLLDRACSVVSAAFPHTYVVGTAQTGGAYRDVDVRTILDDEHFDRLFGDETGSQLWELLCLTTGYYLRAMTGLPVDYQVQRMTEANEKYDGPRNPIGRGRIYAGGGDATRFHTEARQRTGVTTVDHGTTSAEKS